MTYFPQAEFDISARVNDSAAELTVVIPELWIPPHDDEPKAPTGLLGADGQPISLAEDWTPGQELRAGKVPAPPYEAAVKKFGADSGVTHFEIPAEDRGTLSELPGLKVVGTVSLPKSPESAETVEAYYPGVVRVNTDDLRGIDEPVVDFLVTGVDGVFSHNDEKPSTELLDRLDNPLTTTQRRLLEEAAAKHMRPNVHVANRAHEVNTVDTTEAIAVVTPELLNLPSGMHDRAVLLGRHGLAASTAYGTRDGDQERPNRTGGVPASRIRKLFVAGPHQQPRVLDEASSVVALTGVLAATRSHQGVPQPNLEANLANLSNTRN